MFDVRLKSLLILSMLCGLFSGCSEQKKPAAVQPSDSKGGTAAAHSPSATSPSSDSPAKIEIKPATKEKLALTETPKDSSVEATPKKGESRPEPRPFEEAALLPSDVVGLIVIHPKQLFATELGKLALEMGAGTDSGEPAEVLKRLNLKLHEIDRATIIADQAQINQIAVQNGLPVDNSSNPAAGLPDVDKQQLRSAMMRIGLAFHNYHETFGRFPRANGDGEGKSTGLSWRVHLLPYLEEVELYHKFHFDEAWDSEHNKALIANMPTIFRSPDVTENGKTAIHVFTGEKTPFHGDQGKSVRDFPDGTSNTILAVRAGADTAEIWTKPGGLEVDLSAARESLGDIKGQPIQVLFADGLVQVIPESIDDTMLAYLIQPDDGNVVNYGQQPVGFVPGIRFPIPPLILSLNREVDPEETAKGLLSKVQSETYEGQAIYSNGTTAMWFPDRKTVVAGPTLTVQQMISTKLSGKPSESPLIGELQLAADYNIVGDVKSQAGFVNLIVQENPMMGMVANIKTVAAQMTVDGKVGNSLLEVNVTALDAAMAGGLMAMFTIAINQGKMAMMQLPEPPNGNASDKEMLTLMRQVVSSVTVTQNEDKVQLKVPTPSGFNRISELLKPALLSARAAAKETQQRNLFKMIGLAFHNYHDVHGKFPGAGRARPEVPVGLSWRVHLLPFLDEAVLYTQFHLDESWDSEHNKTLIEKMPEIFKSPGVDETGKTSIHVLTGPGAPFADDACPALTQFTDGTSVTFLALMAGPDKAEIWTKPGGLDFDPENPIKALGNLTGESFIALLADGSVRTVNKNIDATTLRRLFQLADGEPVQGP